MFGFGKPKTIPSAEDALPGRPAPIASGLSHFVNGNPLDRWDMPQGQLLTQLMRKCVLGAPVTMKL